MQRLEGARIWFVTNGEARAAGFEAGLLNALAQAGAAQVDVLGVTGAIGRTARGLLEEGVERLAKTLRLRGDRFDEGAVEAFRTGRPNIVLVDHPEVLGPLTLMRDALGLEVLYVGLITDFMPPERWGRARADAFIAPLSRQIDMLRMPHHVPAALQVAGPPVHAGFEQGTPSAETLSTLRQKWGVDEDEKLVFIDVSGSSAEGVRHLSAALGRVKAAWSPIFFYGFNKRVAQSLRESTKTHRLKSRMIGAVQGIEEIVALSDFVLADVGSPMISSYASLGKAILCTDDEQAESALHYEGALVLLPELYHVTRVVERVLSEGLDPNHEKAATRFRSRQGNGAVAEALALIWQGRGEIVSAPSALRGGMGGGTSGEAGLDGTVSGFEMLGESSEAQAVRSTAPLTRDKARKLLAELIMRERKLEQQVRELVGQRDRWMERLSLLEEGEEDMEAFARQRMEEAIQGASALNEELLAIQGEKLEIRKRAVQKGAQQPERSVADPGAEDMERRFRERELRRDLDRLSKADQG